MILPGKHLRQDRALLAIGAELLVHLDEPRTVSELWERVREIRLHGRRPRRSHSIGSSFRSICFMRFVPLISRTASLASGRNDDPLNRKL